MVARRAFTLVELIVLIAVLAVLWCTLIPAMARAKIKSPTAGCLSNIRQLMGAWSMYKEENNDIMMPNAPVGATLGWCGSGTEGWGAANANTNVSTLTTSLMGQYLGKDIRPFRCPADVVPSANGQRLRSYSMNSQMGAIFDSSMIGSYNPSYQIYIKGSDLICPAPASAFIFCDEHPGSINDGFLQVNCNVPMFPDVPASYMNGACGFSFADGHGEIHKWASPQLVFNVIAGVQNANLTVSGTNPDWPWLRQRTACLR